MKYNLNQCELMFLAFAGFILYPVVLLFDFLDDMLELKKRRE